MIRFTLLLGLVLVGAMATTRPVHAQTASQVAADLEGLHDWLGDDRNGRAWRIYLQTDELLAEAKKGSQASRSVVAAALTQFNRAESGLDHPRFSQVRNSLAAWSNQLSITGDQFLVGRILAAATTRYEPIADEQIARKRSALIQSVVRLDEYLDHGGEGVEEGWKTFLNWQELVAQLQTGIEPDLDALGRVGVKYFSGAPGLERPEFVSVRENLVAYRSALLAQKDPTTSKKFRIQLEQLAKSLRDYNENPRGDATSDIASRLMWLEWLDQVPDLVAEVRGRHSSPNLFVSTSERLITRSIGDSISETLPVRENILGTSVCGTAQTNGQITADIVPCQQLATVEILLQGKTHSQTVGKRDPVTVYAKGITNIIGRKRLLIDSFGIRPEPARAACNTTTWIQAIKSDRHLLKRMIERVAWKKANEQKGQAESITARKAEQRVAEMMDQRAAPMIADANARLLYNLKIPLSRRAVYPRTMKFRSTNDRLCLNAIQGSEKQLAASSPPPPCPLNKNITLQLHESMLNNTAISVIAGMTVTDEKAAELMKEATGEVSEELQIKPDDDPWSISFDWQRPASVVFDDNMVTIAIRGRRFTRGDQTLTKTMEISAKYALDRSPSGVRMVRQGDIDVTFPGRETSRLGVRDVTFKTFMRSKFEGLFKEVIDGEGLKMPDQFAQLGKLALDHIASDDGWLTAAWN